MKQANNNKNKNVQQLDGFETLRRSNSQTLKHNKSATTRSLKHNGMVTCAILACKNYMQELQHPARIEGKSNVLENIPEVK